jgi:uncharacterized membrane protein
MQTGNLPEQAKVSRNWSRLASAALVALIVLCVAWERWLAPLWTDGSLLVFKVLPLVPALYGVCCGRRYTSQWLSMVVLLYVIEGVMRANDAGLVSTLARIELILAVVLFIALIGHARSSAPSRQGR